MHLLESVFVLIDLCDDIVLELDPSGKISRTGDVIGDMDKDLCVRAARRLQQISGTTIDAASTLQSAFQRVQAWAEVLATVRAL